ncbi:MAG: class I SAM-dependent methyltransferase [Bacteroidia bacterium]|nr:class I SAM-dependent methyltransferase [Bacteroidia bacterium]
MLSGSSTAFSEEQVSSIYPDGIQRIFWHQARNRLIIHYLRKWKAEPLLEIGAGRGIVLQALLQEGWVARGIELGQATPLIETLPILYGMNVFDMEVEEAAKYRAIALFDVIEHIPDRVNFLKEIRSKFPNMRYLYLTVPASPELWCNYDEFCKHYLRYTPSLFQQELKAAGYRIIFQRYFFHLLYWIIWLTLRVRRRRSEYFLPPKGPLSWVHKLIGWYFFWEGRLLPASWRGASIIAVAEPLSS